MIFTLLFCLVLFGFVWFCLILFDFWVLNCCFGFVVLSSGHHKAP